MKECAAVCRQRQPQTPCFFATPRARPEGVSPVVLSDSERLQDPLVPLSLVPAAHLSGIEDQLFLQFPFDTTLAPRLSSVLLSDFAAVYGSALDTCLLSDGREAYAK